MMMAQRWQNDPGDQDDPDPRYVSRWRQQVAAAAGGPDDHESDLMIVNDIYENRFRCYWLVTAWMVLGFQGMIMLMILGGLAIKGAETQMYSASVHLMGTLVSVGAIGVLAAVYRFVLFPNSRWVPPVVQRWHPPLEHQHRARVHAFNSVKPNTVQEGPVPPVS